MSTAYISHSACHMHDTGKGHPESARRLSAIEDQLISAGLGDFISRYDAPEATQPQLLRVHSPAHLAAVKAMIPKQGYVHLDPDTVLSPATLKAAKRSAGAVVLAVDLLMSGQRKNAFCCVRPPGHHAERNRAMGFCVFNNIAIGAAHALQVHDIRKVAIVDFDVHQGNGTEDIFIDDNRVLYCATFQHPFYPYSALPENSDRVVAIPLAATAKSAAFRAAVSDHWLPALQRFEPQMIFISAGFDAHRDDDMSGVSLTDADFRWVTEQMVKMAGISASGRIISVLEGGYELNSLTRCVETHLRVLMGLT